MSLVALAVRVATVRALTNATLAAGRVFDSNIDSIDQTILEGKLPVIVVVTDDDEATPHGRDLTGADRKLDLVIEVAVATGTTVKVPARPGPSPQQPIEEIVLKIQETDEGLEMTINLIGRQILRVLMSDQGVWPTLWRRIVLRPEKIASRRGAGSEKGVRFAARQMVITTETLAEPGYGAAPEGFWEDFLVALAAETEPFLRELAPILRAEIEMPGLPEWRRWIADLGANPSAAQALGFAPVAMPLDANESPHELDAATVAAENGPDIVIDATAIEDGLGPA